MGADMILAFVSFPFTTWDLKAYEPEKEKILEYVKGMEPELIEEIFPDLFHGNEPDSPEEGREEIRNMVLKAFESFDSRYVTSIKVGDRIVFATGGPYVDGDTIYDNLEALAILIDQMETVSKEANPCPHCGEEVYEVNVDVIETNQYYVYPNQQGTHEWNREEPIDGSEKEMVAYCIHCEKELGKWRRDGRITVGDQSYWGIGYTTWLFKITGAYR